MSPTLADAPKSYEHVLTYLVRGLHSHNNNDDDDDDTLGHISGRYSDLGDIKTHWQHFWGVWDPQLLVFDSISCRLARAKNARSTTTLTPLSTTRVS